jgi:lantibiotic modifying enzyme
MLAQTFDFPDPHEHPVAECYRRFAADRALIERGLGVEGILVDVTPGMGDSHHGGRTVMSLSLDSGHILYYKPRSLLLAVRLSGFLQWLKRQDVATHVAVPASLDRGSYGWALAVPNTATGGIEAGSFLGEGTAIAWVLAARDLHGDNVAIDAERVWILDEEAFLASEPYELPVEARHFFGELDFAADSALYTGLLPRLTNKSSTCRPSPSLYETLEKHIVNKGNSGSSGSRALIQAFTQAYTTTLERLSSLAKSGMLKTAINNWFQGTSSRVIVRPTQKYIDILAEETLADNSNERLLRSAFRKRLIDESNSVMQRNPRVVDMEVSSLLEGDIPRFYIDVSSKIMRLESGTVHMRNSGLDLSRQRCAALVRGDHRQLPRLSCAHLAASRGSDRQNGDTKTEVGTEGSDEIQVIVEHLVRKSLRDRDGALYWAELHRRSDTSGWYLKHCGHGLRTGTCGLTVVLTALAECVPGNRQLSSLAYELEKQFHARMEYELTFVPSSADGIVGFLAAGQALAHFGETSRRTRTVRLIEDEFVRRYGESRRDQGPGTQCAVLPAGSADPAAASVMPRRAHAGLLPVPAIPDCNGSCCGKLIEVINGYNVQFPALCMIPVGICGGLAATLVARVADPYLHILETFIFPVLEEHRSTEDRARN